MEFVGCHALELVWLFAVIVDEDDPSLLAGKEFVGFVSSAGRHDFYQDAHCRRVLVRLALADFRELGRCLVYRFLQQWILLDEIIRRCFIVLIRHLLVVFHLVIGGLGVCFHIGVCRCFQQCSLLDRNFCRCCSVRFKDSLQLICKKEDEVMEFVGCHALDLVWLFAVIVKDDPSLLAGKEFMGFVSSAGRCDFYQDAHCRRVLGRLALADFRELGRCLVCRFLQHWILLDGIICRCFIVLIRHLLAVSHLVIGGLGV